MQYKIFINGKRHKVTLAGDDYKVKATDGSFTPGFKWGLGKNLAGKTISFKPSDHSQFGFLSLTTWLANSGVSIGGPAVVDIILDNDSTIVIQGGYDMSSIIELNIKESNGVVTTKALWETYTAGSIEEDNIITLPGNINLQIKSISFRLMGSDTDYYSYSNNSKLILNWLNEHLIVE